MSSLQTYAVEELKALELELERRRQRTDPVYWAQVRLGDTLWSKQAEILRTIRQRRRTAVKSCHQIGKSYTASIVVGWWLDVHPPGEAFVVTSAPSGPQVKAILWREISRVKARGLLPGRLNQTEWFINTLEGNEELVAFGRKPDDYDPTAFQGIHARYVLYIFDEACGIPASLWEAADSLIANDTSKALAIGNPDDPHSQFAEICKPGSGWGVIEVGAFDTPNFTGEDVPEEIKELLIGRTYVEEKRKKWAPGWRWTGDGSKVVPPEGADPQDTNPLWQSKVLGLFPRTTDEGGLIPIHWVTAAQKRALEPVGATELGVDVGGGGDSSTGALRRGPVVRVLWNDHTPDTMQTAGNVIHHLRTTGASRVKVDLIGIGRGVVDRLKEQNKPVVGVNVGETATEEGYVNMRAQLWWQVRERFENGLIDIDENDEDLAAELVSIKYTRLSNGKIQIESKRDAIKRGVPSPNRADALMLSFAEGPPVLTRATWGRR